jgi:hypothetical protein
MTGGACLCGDIRWEISSNPSTISSCHCSMCRKAHGAAFATYIGVADRDFRWRAGQSSIRTFESSPGEHRPFCPRCGSVVATLEADEGSIFMPAGNMSGDLGRPPSEHIFVASKAPWYEISDDLPQFGEGPPGAE